MSFRSFAQYVCVAVLVGALGAMQASAATIQLSMNYVGSLDAGFNAIGNKLTDSPETVLPSDYHQFAVSFQITGALSNEDLQTLQFDVNMGPGFTPADFGGYQPVSPSPTFDPPGPAGAGAVYTTNVDAGADPNDLQRITVITNSNTTFPHGYRPGISPCNVASGCSGFIGDVFVQWNGSYGGGGETGLSLAPNGLNPWFSIVGTVPTPGLPGSFSTSAPFVMEEPVTAIPPVVNDFEDTAALNETIATIITASGDPATWGPLTNPTYTPDYGAEPDGLGAFFAPQWDPNTQSFSWNTQGSSRGHYTWDVAASNAGGSDTGTITIHVPFVPEPTTVTLVGLALVGFAGVARRRS